MIINIAPTTDTIELHPSGLSEGIVIYNKIITEVLSNMKHSNIDGYSAIVNYKGNREDLILGEDGTML